MMKRIFVVATMAVSLLTATLSMAASPALQALIDGNNNFVAGTLTNLPAKSGAVTRGVVALGQHPIAIVLDCSDSRLSPEILFDKGLGELFVVRVAGNVLDKHQVASIQYGIEHLGAKLLVIMGHERCGAVSAAMAALDDTGSPIAAGYDPLTPELQYLVNTPSLRDAVIEAKTNGATQSVTECVLANVNNVFNEIMNDPAIAAFSVEVVQAYYDLDDGKVSFLDATAIYTVQATSNDAAMGTISPSGDSGVAEGGDQPFVIAAKPGFALAGILVNGEPATLPSGNTFILAGVTSDTTVVANFTSTAPTAAAVGLVGAQLSGVDGAIKAWWPVSATPGASYTVYVNGVLQQGGITGTTYTTANLPNTGSPYTITVQVDAGGYKTSTLTASAPVTVNRTAIAPAWLGVAKAGAGVKLWWPSVATPGVSYVITENGAPITYTLLTSGSLSYTILPSRATGASYSYTLQSTSPGYNDSAVVNGSATIVF